MEFRKYQHIERYGTDETAGIEIGTCYVFPKIDGTNSSVYVRDCELCAASRNRELTPDNDNAGFLADIKDNANIMSYLQENKTHRLFGEWLVPHSLKTYRDDAWRRFYVFDVCIDKGEDGLEYIPFAEYEPLLKKHSIDYIPPIAIIKNGDYEKFVNCIEKNGFLIKDGHGLGEGIVIKNYDFFNKYRRQVWAKIVTNEFKEKHNKEMGAPIVENRLIEENIIDEFLTTSLVEKEYSKIVTEKDGWSSKYIPMLLGKIFYALVVEETWNIIKKHNNPNINFKTLNVMTIRKIKSIKPEIF